MPTTITRTSLLAMMAVAVAIAVIFAAGARLALADQDQAPTGLTLTATDANTVQATWTAHPDGARDYRLSWAPHDENFKTWTDTDWNAFPTGNSYTITGLEGGSTYKVKVRARFETGPPSDWSGIVTATTTAPPNAAATGVPTISGAAQVRETLTAGVSGIADDNGLGDASFDHQWVRSVDGTDTDITGATGSTFLLTYDELDHTIRVRVSFTDDAGYSETLTSAATGPVVRPPNASPGGQPAITGTVEVGETLTVGTSGISDPNGLSNPQYAYQWVRSIGSTDTDISGATGSTYTLTASDLAHTVKVKASFTDDDGYAETLTSNPTGVPDTESDCAEPPVGLASAVNAAASGIVLTWEAPSGCAPDTYAVYRRTASEDGSRLAKIATVDDAGLTYTDGNVSAGEKYRYRVRSNDQGPRSAWTQTVMTEPEPKPGERTGTEPCRGTPSR